MDRSETDREKLDAVEREFPAAILKAAVLAAVFAALVFVMGTAPRRPTLVQAELDRKGLAERVRQETLAAWRAYEDGAWGHDELKPVSKTAKDWYGAGQSLLMTPVDSLDTLLLMGLTEQAGRAKSAILEKLSFDKDIFVKNFEITIRLLGGLLSGYQMTGDERLLRLADDLGTRLLPVFGSPTGMPYVYVNLKTGKTKDPKSNPAEIGTLILEFGTLSKLTGKPVYFERAKRALAAVYERRSRIGLVGEEIDVETGQWTNRASHVGGAIDSYYEYLAKCAVLFGDADCERMSRESLKAVNDRLAEQAPSGFWYGQADMESGARTATEFGALHAFFPAVLALSGDLRRARSLQDSCLKMWNLQGIEPEVLDYRTMKVVSPAYQLRPEIIESAYYLHRYTKDPRYLEMGRTFFEALVRHCRVNGGYTILKDVATKEKGDLMPSYFLAETMKYLYLLFAPNATLDLSHIVFNTEAHPFRREGPSSNITPTPAAGGHHDRGPLDTFRTRPLPGNVWALIAGRGGNPAFFVGPDAVLVIDSQYKELAPGIVSEIRKVTDKPIRFLVNTHHHRDHVEGNETFKPFAMIIAHDNARRHMLASPRDVLRDFPAVLEAARQSGDEETARFAAERIAWARSVRVEEIPAPILTFDSELRIHMGEETIQVWHVPPGHTDGDCAVYFEKANVLHAGDAVVNRFIPVIDVKAGGSVNGYIQALDAILARVPPGAVVVPGHGEVTDFSGIRAFRRYLVDLQVAARVARTEGRTRDAFVQSIELPAYKEFDGYPRRLRDNAGAAYDEAR